MHVKGILPQNECNTQECVIAKRRGAVSHLNFEVLHLNFALFLVWCKWIIRVQMHMLHFNYHFDCITVLFFQFSAFSIFMNILAD